MTIQCRNVAGFAARSIEQVVSDLLAGSRAERTATFILATRASIRRTELTEAVERASDRLADHGIRFGVWDGQELSERLRGLPDLVSRFFGRSTMKLYCTDGEVAAHRPEDVRADGPISGAASVQPGPGSSAGSSVTDRWMVATAGPAIASLSSGLRDVSSLHFGALQAGCESALVRPTVRIGIQIAALPPAENAPRATHVRRRFLELLSGPVIAPLVQAITAEQLASQTWHSYGDVNRSHYAAVLGEPSGLMPPCAWARLILPTGTELAIGRDPRCAAFVLHMDWGSDSDVVRARPPANLQQWRTTMQATLSVPGAIARFLTDKLATTLQPLPAAGIGFWLGTSKGLCELVDLHDFTLVAGTRMSQWFDAYAVAQSDGESRGQLAERWMTQLCDNALHLDDWEDSV